MNVSLKRLSRAAAPLALCALLAPATPAQQQRERPPASQARSTPPPATGATLSPGATHAPRTSSQSAAQSTPQTSSESQPRSQVSEDEADLSITANVTADSLRFEAVPNVTVEFPGRPRRETAWEAERTNLPRPVQPGVTYRDVGVRLKIVSVFADIDRIVAEALGEVPPSDDQPNTTPTPDAQTRPSPPTATNATTNARNSGASGSRQRTPRRAGAQRAGRQR